VSDPRRNAFSLVLVALAATALVALALPAVHLGPGLPLPSVAHGEFQLGSPDGVAAAPVLPVHRAVLVVLAAGLGLVLLLVLWRALRGAPRRIVLRWAGRGLLAVLGAAVALMLLALLARPGPPIPVALPAPPPPPAARTPLGPPPSPLLWIVAAGLVLAAALVTARLLRPCAPAADPLLLRLGLEAERAQAALAAGADARGVILACYARMTAALAEGRGIERPGPTTAREFVEQLGALGLPRAPVGELTALFEGVRYGRRAPTPAEEARAVACLGPIVAHCRAGRREAAP
jgi:hypothetical protein